MSHHKRRRPKNRRAGCLMCKAHKVNGETKWWRKNPQPTHERAILTLHPPSADD